MYFPVLRSGVIVQYPVSRSTDYGLAEAESPGGASWRSSTGRVPVRRWRLELDEISDEEAATLASFYEDCRGGWRTFCFPEPLGNLLVWSEDLARPVWAKSPGTSIIRTGTTSEEPAEFLIVNASGAPGGVWQEVDMAPGAALCFSCEIQGSAGQEAVIMAAGNRRQLLTTDAWRLDYVTGVSGGGAQRVGIELAAGATARVRCLQAEIQVMPSEYQPTYETGGVFPKTRFAQDGLSIVSIAPGRNRAIVILESLMESGL
ncbi:MAG: hypothetical protein NZR01_05075 [Bryobacteraceae bacterium]|nr:hypothetical protein [Bryobacteraceae bacterium]